MKNEMIGESMIRKEILYELFMAGLAIIAVTLSILDITGYINVSTNRKFYWADIVVLIIFAADYFIRLFLTNNKKRFIKENIFDLIAIIPLNSVFRAFRVVRLFRLLRFFRVIDLFNKFTKNSERFLKTNNFIYTLYLCIGTIGLGSVAIYFIEKGKTINSFGDALW